MEAPERLPLDCEPLDEILGGGLEHGVITNVYGESGTGKTNVCVQATASCLADGGTVIYLDTEGGFSAERFLQIHDDRDALERLLLQEPTTFEEQRETFDELEEAMQEHDADLLVVDSLVALYRIRLQDEEASETNRELSRQLSILSKIARQQDVPVLVTNQVYSPFESDEVRMVGRDVPTYWSKCLLKLETAGTNRRRAIVKKHRSRPEGLEAEFLITNEGLLSNGKDPEVQLY
ncbi:MAG: DNA repair and recombination protein RadB [Candidatus Nanohaloarchaea archaeon]|nr:DNA repair and recombination protein RadB [Candidatus Nanohaloarchaea archaeon]